MNHFYEPSRRSPALYRLAVAVALAATGCGDAGNVGDTGEQQHETEAVAQTHEALTKALQPAAEGKDATISSKNPTTPSGGDGFVGGGSWTWGGTPGNLRGLLQFDLSALTGLDIKSAQLTLSADPASSTINQLSTMTGSNAVILKRITSPWEEGSVTWNTQPTTSAEDVISFGPSSGTPSTYTLDVTKLVTIMARPGMNYGFMIQLVTEAHYRSMRFASSDHANAALRPKLTVEYVPRCGASPTLFCEVAYIGAPTCSDSDYSNVDNCYNNCNPPYPSLLRPTSTISPGNGTAAIAASDGSANRTVPFWYDYGQPDAATGATAVLPFVRTTNDGRIAIQGGCRGCEGSNLQVFRPEAIGYDFALKSNNPPLPKGQRGAIHPFVYYNPITSRLPGVPNNSRMPNANHANICDVSGSAVSDNETDALSGVLSKKGRNPVACSAHELPENDANPAADLQGDCYDITLMYDLESDGVWEMRTVDVTLFVPGPKSSSTLSSGNAMSIWMYPRNPSGEVRTDSSWRLPAYRPFNIHYTDWNKLGAGVNWSTLLTTDPQFNCYSQTSPTLIRNPSGPKWCEFFDRQRQNNSFNVDNNRNSTLGDGVQWNGSACGGAQSGASGSCQPMFLFEPVTSADGRLLIANVNGLYYSYNSLGACRADGWTKFMPISSMPADANIYNNYDIGRSQRISGISRPFRDPLGNEIPFGTLNFGAYPWLDRQGKNLFFAEANNPRDGYFARNAITPKGVIRTAAQYPPSAAERAKMNPDRSPAMRQTVVGAWTQGKMITVDNGVNATDISGHHNDDPNDWGRMRYDMRLLSGADYRLLPMASSNISSFENQFNYLDALRPTLPYDVVWTVQSNIQRNAEVVFDEYMRNDAFIVAHMNAPSAMNGGPSFVKDGFTAANPGAYVRGGETADFRFRESPLLQNAATSSPLYSSTAVRPPANLRVRGGARVEPLALGGVLGKGLYLDGVNDFIDVGYQMDSSRKNWSMGLWLDSRDESTQGVPRTIFFFSDDSWIGLQQKPDGGGIRQFSLVAYNGRSKSLQELPIGTLVQTGKYFHLGVKIGALPLGRKLDFLVNGTPVGSLTFAVTDASKPGFDVMYNSLNNGWTWIAVGDPGPGFVAGQVRAPFKGWIDEFRVYALDADDLSLPWTEEFLCNSALGTLVDVSVQAGETSDTRLDALRALAEKNPSHPSVVCEQMKLETYTGPLDFAPQYNRGLCIDRVHKNARPDPSLAARCLRAAKLDTSSRPLTAEAPRPDFSSVAFCQSCHHGQAKISGLLMGALTGGTTLPRWSDPRRQPLDRPAVLSGVRPSWLWQGYDLLDRTRTLDHSFDTLLAMP